MISPVTPSTVFAVGFFDVSVESWEVVDGERSLVCMRREMVRTNWPTQAPKPERKALKGCFGRVLVLGVLFLRIGRMQGKGSRRG